MKKILMMFALCFALCASVILTLPSAVQASIRGDDPGQQPSPPTVTVEIIATAADLNAVRNNLGKHYKLANDIDINDGTTTLGTEGWEPIGDNAVPFTGYIDGAGHKITGLWINSDEDYVGLFGAIGGVAEIKNLGVEIIGEVKGGIEVGGLVGVQTDNSTIRNCYVTGNVTAQYFTGGLVGVVQAGGRIMNCYATGNVTADFFTGGLVGGQMGNSTIRNCYAAGNVTANSEAGGLVGQHYKGSIINCVALNGVVEAGSINAGRVAGRTYASVEGPNYANSGMKVKEGGDEVTVVDGVGGSGIHGAGVASAEYQSEDWWNNGKNGFWKEVYVPSNPDNDRPWVWSSAYLHPVFYWQNRLYSSPVTDGPDTRSGGSGCDVATGGLPLVLGMFVALRFFTSKSHFFRAL